MIPKPNSDSKFYDVRLVSRNDPFYTLNERIKYKTIKNPDLIYISSHARRYQAISYLVELVIREWTGLSKYNSNDCIISYKHSKRNKTQFKEIDYVLQPRKNRLILGEIKCSIDQKNSLKAATQQLKYSREILSSAGFEVEKLQFIYVNPFYFDDDQKLDTFEESFDQMSFRKVTYEGLTYHRIDLSLKDVFDYGVKMEVIKCPEIWHDIDESLRIKAIYYKAEETFKKIERQVKLGTEVREENLESSLSEKAALRSMNHLLDFGYTICKNEKELKALLNFAYKVHPIKESDLWTHDQMESSGGLGNIGPRHRFVSYRSEKGDAAVDLIDAEQVFLRFNLDIGVPSLMKINFRAAIGPEKSGQGANKLVTRTPSRVFSLTGPAILESADEESTLMRFYKILVNSDKRKVILMAGEILVIDNHRMFYGFNSQPDGL